MVEWATTEEGVTVLDGDRTVAIEADGWRRRAPRCSLPCPVDAAVSGSARSLRLPTDRATLTAREGLDVSVGGPLPDGEYLLTAGTGPETLARFRGPATVVPREGSVHVRFPTPSAITLGFRGERDEPGALAVSETPTGVAAAITRTSEAHADRGPERSHPAYRDHPPLLEFDADASLPTAGGDRELTFRVPADLEYVLVAAPLAYYLGAELVAEERNAPLLTAPSLGFEQPFGHLPAFATEVSAACRRVFYLDCLVRDLPFEGDRERRALDALGLRPERVRDASPAVRYATYLDAPFSSVDDLLPSWHLSTYVEPTYEHARALPHLLDRLSLVYPAEASEMAARDLLERSLDDFYRGEVVTIQPLAPELGAGTVHGWLADGEPVDAFKATAEAYENGFAAPRPDESLSVDLVLNDPGMEAERAVADIYRRRATDLPVDVRVHERLTTDELADVFETPTDFVHYVGHCEVDGLRCRDGYLSAADLEASRARTFFLNACGSYREGESLVQRGSVAGAVTLKKVLNEQAATVGTAFGRLLVHGYGIERSLSLARRRIMMGKDYAVVGDGTYALTPTCGDPAVVTVEESATGFLVECAVASARGAGRSYTDPLTGQTGLYGQSSERTLDRADLLDLLDRYSVPVIHEGDLTWSDELAASLEMDGGTREDAHGS